MDAGDCCWGWSWADEIEEEDILSYSEVSLPGETKEKSSEGLKKYLQDYLGSTDKIWVHISLTLAKAWNNKRESH